MLKRDFVDKIIKNYQSNPISDEISPRETMLNQWYFQVGASAANVIISAIQSSRLSNVGSILDLPCGHGRVTRHIRAMFPEASIDVCDLDSAGVDFCAEKFAANPVYSRAELTELALLSRYDIIWVGSLFTHTSCHITRSWLTHLSNFLTSNGIVIATFHGRWSEYVHMTAPYIAEESWKKILEEYKKSGYGYFDYTTSESHDYICGSYGISLARPRNVVSIIEEIPNTRIFLYTERGWADHQDVAVFGKPTYDEPWPSLKSDKQ